MQKLKFLFSFDGKVTQKEYLTWGIILGLLKYLGEALLYGIAFKEILLPHNFLSPFISQRYPGSPSPDWFLPLIAFWSIPFIGIGIGMSLRRCLDAKRNPWLSLLFLVPIVNWVFIIFMLFQKSNAKYEDKRGFDTDQKQEELPLKSHLLTILTFALLASAFIFLLTNKFKNYGSSLFLFIPLILGAVEAFFLKQKFQINNKRVVFIVGQTFVVAHFLIFLFAIEGAICLLMSLPIVLPVSLFGAIIGSTIASVGNTSKTTPLLLLISIPGAPLVEEKIQGRGPFKDQVVSEIVINAPASKVWNNVVTFSELPPPKDWLFKTGIAFPLRATIKGSGVGSIRYCEFSTGAFVEPITIWDEPRKLEFSVQEQPIPMKEFTPYEKIHAPHLHGFFKSVKGQFLLEEQDGKTILKGSTWYHMEILPGSYWQIYARWIIHKIHWRVLSHIKSLSETVIE